MAGPGWAGTGSGRGHQGCRHTRPWRWAWADGVSKGPTHGQMETRCTAKEKAPRAGMDGWRGGDSGGLASAAPPGAPPNALQPACRAEPASLGTVLLFPSPCPCAGTFPVGRGLGPSFGRGFLTVARAGCPGCHPWALCSLSCPGPRGLGPWCPYSLTVT